MRRSYLAYLIVAVLPSLVAVVAGAAAAQRAWQDLRAASWGWVGTTALNALQEDLVGAVRVLAATAEPTPVAPDDPAWQRVSGGDTVSALRPRASGAEVMVLTGPRPGDPPGTLRYAGAPIPSSPLVVARTTGSRLTVYLNGRRALTTPDSLGPDSLPRQTLVALSDAPGGLPMAGEGGALVALDHPRGTAPSVAVMVGPATKPDAPLPLSLLLVVGLLFLFAGLAGWIQLGARRASGGGRTASMLAVSLVPVLTALAFLFQTDRLFQEATRADVATNLTRALAVANTRGVVDSPARIHALTGFQATRVRNGEVEESTLGEPLTALAGLAAPPPSFSAAGTVTTSEGPSQYVALRVSGGGFVVASARRPEERGRAFRRGLVIIAGLLGAWLLAGGWMAGIGAAPGAGPEQVAAPSA